MPKMDEETLTEEYDLTDAKEAGEGIKTKKTSSWITYVKKNMTGMKGKSQQEIRDHMRKIAAEWKKMK
jgi:hypothetical protein